ncbi:hypothetical protein AMATHDRAFT_150200 [Amanita thiersii Skay4041]|uniref:glutathione transferase n=1 Tax=Amanita thiersii Skay4041 TaxID=703135 RepID=A0A2A9NKT2_9AGAR|nr:hypothetical protein AMATHDRAFT_150200 [Amanita thiersii Skay4041]
MVLKLYGFSTSAATRRVAVVLLEKQVPFEFCVVRLDKGEQRSETNLKHQPFGQVPYIDDDGFILYESRAICRYIALKFANQGTPLIPDGKDLKKLALFEQTVSIEQSQLEPPAAQYVLEKIVKPMFGETPDEALVTKYCANFRAKLDVYEKILSKQEYIGGDELTLADLFHLPYVMVLEGRDINTVESYPNLARWFGKLSARPTWQKVLTGIESTV